MISSPAQSRCVLLSAPEAGVDPGLLGSLRAKIAGLVRVTNAYAALGEICRCGDQIERPPSALVLYEPEKIAGRVRLLAAAERYAPQTVVWTFQHGANPALRPVVLSEASAQSGRSAEAGAAAPAKPGAKPSVGGIGSLRLVGNGAGGAQPTETEPGDEPSSRKLLTPDELSMLMGEE